MSAPVASKLCKWCGCDFTGKYACQKCSNTVGSVQGRLRMLGVLNNKHVPTTYLRASEGQRRALLAGLLDTDGTVTAGGSVQFTGTSKRLVSDVREIIVGLGYRCRTSSKRVKGHTELRRSPTP